MLSGHPFVPASSSPSLPPVLSLSFSSPNRSYASRPSLCASAIYFLGAVFLPVHPSVAFSRSPSFPPVFVRPRKNNGFSFDRPCADRAGPASESRLNWKYVIRQCVKSSDFPAILATLSLVGPLPPGQDIAPRTPVVTDVVGRNRLFSSLSRLQQ